MDLTVDALLFDIDGTLVDSTPAVERSWRRLAASRGLDADLMLRTAHGRRSRDTLAEHVPADELEDAARELEAHEAEDIDDVVALPAAVQILAALPAGLWAAVTSGPRTVMCARLAAAGLPVPDVFIAAEDVGVGKPDPEGYRAAASRLGADPARCLVVEDAPAGIGAGRAAGAHVLAVATSHDAERLTDADAVVPDLTHVQVTSGAAGVRVVVGG